MSVDKQPQSMQMNPLPPIQGMPPGLQYLAGLDKIIIKQKIELFEVLTGFETRNRYAVYNSDMQQIFFIQEESSLCERCFFPMNRGFQLHMTDNNSQEICRITRDFKCCLGCCWCADGCCMSTINVEAPVGRLIGKIKTGNSKWKFHTKVYDVADNHMFTSWGPCCPCQTVCCPEDIDFPLTDPSLTTRVGNIAKQWRGCCVEMTDADQFAVTFPADMTVDAKCLIIGACFMIEYLVFETQKNQNS